MDEFRRRLKKAMFENQLTQMELAAEIGCHQCDISYWQNGKSLPRADKIVAMCKVFNVSADWLLGLEGGKDERRKKNRL